VSCVGVEPLSHPYVWILTSPGMLFCGSIVVLIILRCCPARLPGVDVGTLAATDKILCAFFRLPCVDFTALAVTAVHASHPRYVFAGGRLLPGVFLGPTEGVSGCCDTACMLGPLKSMLRV
jgi:hypothetical protein